MTVLAVFGITVWATIDRDRDIPDGLWLTTSRSLFVFVFPRSHISLGVMDFLFGAVNIAGWHRPWNPTDGFQSWTL